MAQPNGEAQPVCPLIKRGTLEGRATCANRSLSAISARAMATRRMTTDMSTEAPLRGRCASLSRSAPRLPAVLSHSFSAMASSSVAFGLPVSAIGAGWPACRSNAHLDTLYLSHQHLQPSFHNTSLGSSWGGAQGQGRTFSASGLASYAGSSER